MSFIGYLEIGEDKITVCDLKTNTVLTINAMGGPRDSFLLSALGKADVELTIEHWNTIQQAFVNFYNTGYFNQED